MTIALHPAPSWRTVVEEQLRMAGTRWRAAVVALACVMCVLAAGSLRVAWMTAEANRLYHLKTGVNFTFSPQVSVVLVSLGLLLPLMLWQDEDPARRMYHWAMPVSQTRHALARVLAGWLSLMGTVAVFLAGMVLVKVISERMTGMPQRYDAGFVWWEWLIPFTSVTVGYLFASVAGIATRRPLTWIFGLPLLFMTSMGLLNQLNAGPSREIARVMAKVTTGYFGASAAVAGTIDSIDPRTGFALPSLARWLGATSIWLAVAALLLYLVTRRRVEPNA